MRLRSLATRCPKLSSPSLGSDNTDALALVRADNASVFYDRLSTETYAEVSAYPEAGIIVFEPVRR